VSVLLREAQGFEGFLLRPVLPALDDQALAQTEDEDVRVPYLSTALTQPSIEDRWGDHEIVGLDQLEHLDSDLGERVREPVNEPCISISANVRARVRLVRARVVDELRVNAGQVHV
jgi:hypothetical protein